MRLRWRWFDGALHGQYPYGNECVIIKPGYGCWVMDAFGIHPSTMEKFPAEVSSIPRARRLARLIILAELERQKRRAKRRRVR